MSGSVHKLSVCLFVFFVAIGGKVFGNSDTVKLKALLSSKSSIIELPKDKVFYIDETLNIPSDKKINGNGATLVALDFVTKLFALENVHNIQFVGVKFKGSVLKEVQQAAFSLKNVTKLSFQRCFFDSITADSGFNQAIFCYEGCDELLVEDCHFKNIRGVNSGNGYSIHVANSKNVQIRENYFESRPQDGRHAVYLSHGTIFSKVENNRIYNYHCGAISLYSYPYQKSTSFNIIKNNFIYGGNNRFEFDGAITVFQNCNDNEIKGNTIVKSGAYGILLSGDERSIPQSMCRGNKIVSNKLDSIGKMGIGMWGVRSTLVSDNEISMTNWHNDNSNSYAIGVFDDVNYHGKTRGVKLLGNRIYNNDNAFSGIKVLIESTDIEIEGNISDSRNDIVFTNYFRWRWMLEKHSFFLSVFFSSGIVGLVLLAKYKMNIF